MANHDGMRSSWNTPESVETWRVECGQGPPAYAGAGFAPERKERGGLAACCAFEKLDAATQAADGRSQMPQSPQLRLVSWVLLCRIADDSLPPRLRFSCPMADCPQVFSASQHMQLVSHISGCPHLSDGRYTCPYHEEPQVERFMEPARPQRTRKGSKRGFFRQTIGKICGLGSRSVRARPSPASYHISAPLPAPFSRSITLPTTTARNFATAPMKRPFQEDGPASAAALPDEGPAELDGFPNGAFNFTDKFFAGPMPADGEEQTKVELPTNVIDTIPELDVPHWAGLSQSSEYLELSEKRMSASSLQSISIGSLTPAEQSPISPLTPQSIFSTEGFDHRLSPSTVDVHGHGPPNKFTDFAPAATSLVVPQHSLYQQAASSSSSIASGSTNRKRVRQVPKICVDTSCNNVQPATENVSPFSSAVSSESAASETLVLPPANSHAEMGGSDHQQLVQELRGLFNYLFKRSMRKLCSPMTPAGLHLLHLRPSAASVFEAGLQALHRVVKNEVPQDLLEIFGLSILPYACGTAAMDATMTDQFGTIFQEQIGWSQAIADSTLRQNYIQLVWDLWSTTEYQMFRDYPTSQQAAVDNMEAFNQPWTLNPSMSSPDLDFGIDPGSSMDMPSLDERYPFLTSPFSVHDTALKLCLNFLDAFEYLQVNLQDTNAISHDAPSFGYNVPSSPDYSSVVMDHVIQPLSSNLMLGTFRPVIDLTCFLIAETNNITLRNTELSLLEEGKSQGSERQIYLAFAEEVRRLSDNAATIMGCMGYRSLYYANDISKVVQIHNELLAIERFSRSASRRYNQRHRRSRSSSLTSTGKGKGSLNVSPTSSGCSDSPMSSAYRSHAFNFSSTSSSPIDAGMFHSRNNSSEDVFAGGLPDPFQASPTAQRRSSSALERPHPLSRAAEASSHTATEASSAAPKPSSDPITRTPRPDEKVKRQCPWPNCNQVFEQQAQYIKANITRHIREKHRDNAKKLVCSEPGCSYTSTRKGNLTHHQRAVHGLHTRASVGTVFTSEQHRWFAAVQDKTGRGLAS